MDNSEVIKRTTEPVREALNDITVTEKLINGTQLLAIYYAIVFLFFIIDVIIVYKQNQRRRKGYPHIARKPLYGPFSAFLVRLYRSYKRYGLYTLNAIILIICIIIIVSKIGFEWHLIFSITASVVVITVFMKLALRIFINKNSYENDATTRSINLICYILLGDYFCYNMSFISSPDLLLSLTGLTVALLLCYYIMLHAIFNPRILQKSATSYILYSESFGIIKGMLAVLMCMLTTLYLMLYSCWRTSPAFFALSTASTFDEWDLLYYMIISFTTIGYGDIVPVRYNGLFYSRYIAIVIGLSSMFTTACFVAAVISTANSIAATTREKHDDFTGPISSKLIKSVEEKPEQIRHKIKSTLDSLSVKDLKDHPINDVAPLDKIVNTVKGSQSKGKS